MLRAREEAGNVTKIRDEVTGAMRDYIEKKEAKKKRKKKKKGGFMAGLKKSMGGDLILRTTKPVETARNELGQKIGRGIRSSLTNNVKERRSLIRLSTIWPTPALIC